MLGHFGQSIKLCHSNTCMTVAASQRVSFVCHPIMQRGLTALHSAAAAGHQDVVALLLSEGAVVDSADYVSFALFGQLCST